MSSMLYTMGMALDRAAENGYVVSILVEGAWLDGSVAAVDSVGVVIEGVDGSHSVIRTERITAVKVLAESPYRVSIGGSKDAPGWEAPARPMPGPQPAYA
jgi:hypothetical protein